MADKRCRCNCGYSCGRKCGLEIMECMEKHYKRDCEHDFSGPMVEVDMMGSCSVDSVVCTKCGLTAFGHDMSVGP